MTLSADMTTDLATFYSADDFAVAAYLNGSATPINVLFSNPFAALNPATGSMESTAPEARCKAPDVSSAVHGSTLIVASVTYYIIGIQPTEDGLETILVLSKDAP